VISNDNYMLISIKW